MKYLITGLGNPGPQYEDTRHNIGFRVVEELSKRWEAPFQSASFGMLCKTKYKGRQVLLLKPDTFMNLSGKAVKAWMQKENIPLTNVLVITDDLSLDFGKLRMKKKGSDAGHNGLKSLQQELGTQEYPRLRFGISQNYEKGKQADYVLGEWNAEEKCLLPERVEMAAKAVEAYIFTGIELAMTGFNGK